MKNKNSGGTFSDALKLELSLFNIKEIDNLPGIIKKKDGIAMDNFNQISGHGVCKLTAEKVVVSNER